MVLLLLVFTLKLYKTKSVSSIYCFLEIIYLLYRYKSVLAQVKSDHVHFCDCLALQSQNMKQKMWEQVFSQHQWHGTLNEHACTTDTCTDTLQPVIYCTCTVQFILRYLTILSSSTSISNSLLKHKNATYFFLTLPSVSKIL